MTAAEIAFAEEGRKTCTKALSKMLTGQQEAAGVLLTQFGEKCARIVAEAKMQQEQADLREDRFDLAALKVDMQSAAPEREAD